MYSYPNSMIRLASSPGGLKMALPLLDMDADWEGAGAGEGEKEVEAEVEGSEGEGLDESGTGSAGAEGVQLKIVGDSTDASIASKTDMTDGDDTLATSSLSSFLNASANNSTIPDSFEITTVKNTLSHVIQSPPSSSPYDPLPLTTTSTSPTSALPGPPGGQGEVNPAVNPLPLPLTYKRPTQPWKNNFNISKTDNVKYILQQQNENYKRYKSNQLTEAIFHTNTKLKLMTERFPTSSSTTSTTTSTGATRRVVQPYSKGEIQSALYHFMKVAYCAIIYYYTH